MNNFISFKHNTIIINRHISKNNCKNIHIINNMLLFFSTFNIRTHNCSLPLRHSENK